MALLDLRRYKFNNYTNKVESTIKSIDAIANRDRMYNCLSCEPQPSIEIGDSVVIGTIPRNCFVTDIRILYVEGFDVGVTFDMGFLADFPEDTLVPFATDIVATGDNLQQWISLPQSGAVDGAGVQVPLAETDYRAGIWNGDERPLALGIKVNGAEADGTPLTVGKCKVLISFIRFGDEDIHRGELIPEVY